ncbi:MAG: hypothetical protein QN131_14750 [Armatimonadota bacterium]|nr:hypothetical protein [Armatimonadota bacterium]
MRFGLVDRPREDRWHRRPVPRLGGVAIYAGFTIPLVWVNRTNPAGLLPLLVGGAVIFAVGLIDDVVRLENRTKLILLIVSAAVPVLLGVRFERLPALVGTPLAMIWILGATNAFNWLDNMDGVAGGIGAISAGTTAAFALLSGRSEAAVCALLLAGACLGFLLHNFPPARLFMGDSGSGFLGFTLATIAVMGSSRDVSNVLLPVLVPGLILAVPIFDTALVAVQRLLHGRSIFQGGRDHPAHRLVAMGLPERKAVLMLYGLSLLAASLALFAARLDVVVGLIVSVGLGLAFAALGIVLSEVRVYEAAPNGNGATALPQAFVNKRWILVMALDLLLVVLAYAGAHLLRFDGTLPPRVADAVVDTLPLVVAAKMVGLYAAGVYRGSWRYAGALDYGRIVEGAAVGSVLAVGGLFLWMRLEGLSRGALLLDWLLTVALVGGSRLSLTFLREFLVAQAEGGRRVLIFGAGLAGALLLRQLREDGGEYRPVGFLDDDPATHGTYFQGLKVLGGRDDLPALLRRLRVDAVIVAAPNGSSASLAELRSICEEAGADLKRFEVSLR